MKLMTLITINKMTIPDTSELGQDERSFQPLIYPEYVFPGVAEPSVVKVVDHGVEGD
jgi:hypothetical protein